MNDHSCVKDGIKAVSGLVKKSGRQPANRFQEVL